jgi:hypothetical protein
MKEYPILFSGPMVQALLNTKPNTWPAEPIDPSKPLKFTPRRIVFRINGVGPVTEFGESSAPGYKWHFRDRHLRWHDAKDIKPPYQEGDILWVRETFTKDQNGECIYRADPVFDNCGKGDISWAWISPLFLSYEAARIKLEVKNVRIERVQDITEEDARAEGVKITAYCGTKPEFKNPVCAERNNSCYVCAFKDLWDTLNAKRGHSWDRNPWVLVIEFIRIR